MFHTSCTLVQLSFSVNAIKTPRRLTAHEETVVNMEHFHSFILGTVPTVYYVNHLEYQVAYSFKPDNIMYFIFSCLQLSGISETPDQVTC